MTTLEKLSKKIKEDRRLLNRAVAEGNTTAQSVISNRLEHERKEMEELLKKEIKPKITEIP